MGEVYEAENEIIHRHVAIKVLRPALAHDGMIVQRFIREAQAANRVRHANVVDVLDVGTDDGTPFMVQELLHGRDLGAHMEASGGWMTVDDALAVLLPVAEAVALAHTNGVVHRDLKPENVFLAETPAGVVPKVLDFGISKFATCDDNVRLTSTSAVIGTPAYMSPEQFENKQVDAHTDVWSFGVMLYEVLSGELPFNAETSATLYARIISTDAVPLAERLPAIAPEIDRVVMRCLRRAPAERYADLNELLPDLRGALDAYHQRQTRPSQEFAPVLTPVVWAATGLQVLRVQENIRESTMRPVQRRKSRRVWVAVALASCVAVSIGILVGVTASGREHVVPLSTGPATLVAHDTTGSPPVTPVALTTEPPIVTARAMPTPSPHGVAAPVNPAEESDETPASQGRAGETQSRRSRHGAGRPSESPADTTMLIRPTQTTAAAPPPPVVAPSAPAVVVPRPASPPASVHSPPTNNVTATPPVRFHEPGEGGGYVP